MIMIPIGYILVLATGLQSSVLGETIYQNSFEGSTYAPCETLISVDDIQAGSTWRVFSTNGKIGGNLTAVVSDDNPADGKHHFRLKDHDSDSNISASLTMQGNSADNAGILSLKIKIAPRLEAGTGMANISFGDSTPFPDRDKGNYWLLLNVDAEENSPAPHSLVLDCRTSQGGQPSGFRLRTQDGKALICNGDNYVEIVVIIDTSTLQYQSILVDNVEQLGLGVNPTVAFCYATFPPERTLSISSATPTVGAVDIDEVVLSECK